MRLLRIVRLVKLVRLLRFAKILDELQKTYPDFEPAYIKYFTLCATLLFAAHFFGCFWASQLIADIDVLGRSTNNDDTVH